MVKNIIIENIKDTNRIKEIIKLCSDSIFNQNINNNSSINELINKYVKNGIFLSVISNGNVCGFAAFYANDNINNIAYLSMIVVRKYYQHLGIGKRLMNDIIKICRENGMRSIKLEVDKNNFGAIGFYKTLNFEVLNDDGSTLTLKKHL